jgi:hypothetical protein
MTKADLVGKIAEKTGLTKANAERALNAFIEAVEETLVGEGKITLTGFGTFMVDERRPAPDAIRAPAPRSTSRRPRWSSSGPVSCLRTRFNNQHQGECSCFTVKPSTARCPRTAWWQPDHFVFFSVLYLVLFIIASGMGYCVVKAFKDTIRGGVGGHH